MNERILNIIVESLLYFTIYVNCKQYSNNEQNKIHVKKLTL